MQFEAIKEFFPPHRNRFISMSHINYLLLTNESEEIPTLPMVRKKI